MKSNVQILSNIKSHISNDKFQISLVQNETDKYFPDFLGEKLKNYIEYYENNLMQYVDLQVPFGSGQKDVIVKRIRNLSELIIRTVDFYYKGKFDEAFHGFYEGLQVIIFNRRLSLLTEIDPDSDFYRARINEKKHFTKVDLFHIRFEERHLVSTNRFSAPGFPALYLGDSTYVCWEEFERYKLRELWFSRLCNKKKLKVIQIQRIEDCLATADELTDTGEQLSYLLRYFVTFPLTLACSMKVKHCGANFKPEYIIPQLLLQFITKKDDIDGIKYPSTRVDYSKLLKIKAYNYVFPVREIEKSGYCNSLIDVFSMTEPTSLELEEIGFNPSGAMIGGNSRKSFDFSSIELIKDIKRGYMYTSFGKIENLLAMMEDKKINKSALDK